MPLVPNVRSNWGKDLNSIRQVKHRNHYVPKLYLKMWSSNGNTIYTYDTVAPNKGAKVWRTASIKNSACWTDFYTRTIDGADNDDVETYLDKRYEAPAKIVFERIAQKAQLSSNDKAVLVDFLTIQMCRTPGWYLKLSKLLPTVFESALEEVSEHIEEASKLGSLKREIQEAACNSRKEGASEFRPPLKVNVDRTEGLIRVDTVMGRSLFLETIKQIEVGEVGKALRSYYWRIVEVPEEFILPTSDNPVVLLSINEDGSYSFNGGVGQKNIDIIMPLSPRHFLFTEVGKECSDIENISFSKANFALIRNAIIDNATRYVYSLRPIAGIQNLRPRIIDPCYYHELEETRSEWHQRQSEVEREYQSGV